GSIIFSNGTSLAQDNSDFFWDDSNNRLGIGTSSPNGALHVMGNARIGTDGGLNFAGNSGSLFVQDRLEVGGDVWFSDSLHFESSVGSISSNSSGSDPSLTFDGVNDFIYTSSANVGIGTSSPAYLLDVAGTGRFND